MKKIRTLAMIDYVRERKYCSTSELQRAFDVSPATIQRDIAEIIRSKQLRKVHGGVAAIETSANSSSASAADERFGDRVMIHPDEKRTIAKLAIPLISEGDVLFLDSSTTALFLARELRTTSFKNITIITNSASLAEEFRSATLPYSLICLGGTYDAHLNAYLGKATLEWLKRYTLDKAFISAAGITSRGLFTHHEALAEFLENVMRGAKISHALVDSSKFNKNAVFGICSLAEVPSLVTDAPPPSDIAQGVGRVIQPSHSSDA